MDKRGHPGQCQSRAWPPGGKAAVHTSARASPEAGVGWRLQGHSDKLGWHRNLALDPKAALRCKLPREITCSQEKLGSRCVPHQGLKRRKWEGGGRNGKTNTHPLFQGRTESKPVGEDVAP